MTRKFWRCFHCDAGFTNREKAQEHFGRYQDCDPICTVGAARYRDLEDQLASFQSESDAASKTFYEMGARHAGELRRAEEQGYAKGLRDAALEYARADRALSYINEHAPRCYDTTEGFARRTAFEELRAVLTETPPLGDAAAKPRASTGGKPSPGTQNEKGQPQ